MKKKPIKGGPKSKTGKAVSSRNATTHGLTAKRWLSPVEEDNYHSFLKALTDDFQPKSLIEHILIEKLADTKTRLDRFHNVEDALFNLAEEHADSPENVADSFGIDEKEVLEELSDHAFGILKRKDLFTEEFFVELISHDPSEVSGWGYIKENMPLLREHIFEECRKENLNVEDLMSRYSDSNDKTPKIRVIIHTSEKPESISEEDLDESGLKVRKETLIAYMKTFFAQTRRRYMINSLIRGYDNRTQLLKRSALPDGPLLDRLMRYRTTLERQFSKTLGELLHIINLRNR